MSDNTLTYSVVVASVIFATAYYGNTWVKTLTGNGTGAPVDDYASIKQYLLNDSDLFSDHKPKIWVHSKFEYNARKWQSFHSRSSYDLNQPYIHLTIKTIIDHCGADFHVCLIDDQTFSKLLPEWDIDLTRIADPLKTRYREIGMMELMYKFGGMVLPNSTLCLKSLKDLYYRGIESGKPFVCETVNRTMNMGKTRMGSALAFIPSTYIMGANKADPVVKEFVDYLKRRNSVAHFSAEVEFMGDTSHWCLSRISSGDMRLVGGELVGVKTVDGKPVLLEHLMEDNYLHLSPMCVAVYIPEDEMLVRTKYQWFSVMSVEEVMRANVAIVRYMKTAMDSEERHVDNTVSMVPSI
jgi:hypothetical protein